MACCTYKAKNECYVVSCHEEKSQPIVKPLIGCGTMNIRSTLSEKFHDKSLYMWVGGVKFQKEHDNYVCLDKNSLFECEIIHQPA